MIILFRIACRAAKHISGVEVFYYSPELSQYSSVLFKEEVLTRKFLEVNDNLMVRVLEA